MTERTITGSPMHPAWMWRLAARLDRRAVLKLQQRYEPGSLTPEEALELAHVPGVYRWGKRLRRLLRG